MTVTELGTGQSGETVAVADPPPPMAGWPTDGRPGRRWRRWILLSAIGLVIALVLAGGISFLVYGSTYQPLSWGDTAGVVSPSLKTIGDGLDDTDLILVGPKGTTGAVRYALANRGSDPVRILADSNNFDSIPVVKLAWEPEMMDGAIGGGTVAQERPLPVTIPAHNEIALWITTIQPACSGSGWSTEVQVNIRWSALGWHHSTWLQLGTQSIFLPIVTCPPKSALSHINPTG
jgi:hypothetical protein